MIQKRRPYRNKKILVAARGERCTFNSPVCNYDPETTVFCHLNESFAGKGISQKADDYAGFFGCSNCHDLYDGRATCEISHEIMTWYVLRAQNRTIRRLLEKGVIS